MASKVNRTRNKTYVLGLYHSRSNTIEEWEIKGHSVAYVVDGVEQIFLNVVNSNKQVVFSVNAARLAYLFVKGSAIQIKSGEQTKVNNVVAGIRPVKVVE